MRSRTNVECVKTKMAFLLLLLPSCKTLYAVAFVRVMSRPTVRGRIEQRAEHCVHGLFAPFFFFFFYSKRVTE
ncbi:hypothetical protein HDV64DRAFT_224496 [Trichoderma sp. TUCIM 5745]